jgi:hypothetical protein
MTPEELYQDWQKKEGIRFLNEDNSVPSLDDRLKHAFMAGLHHNYIKECMRATMLRLSVTNPKTDEAASQ